MEIEQPLTDRRAQSATYKGQEVAPHAVHSSLEEAAKRGFAETEQEKGPKAPVMDTLMM